MRHDLALLFVTAGVIVTVLSAFGAVAAGHDRSCSCTT